MRSNICITDSYTVNMGVIIIIIIIMTIMIIIFII